MQKYRFPALTEILKVKVGTKYVWEERVRQQAILVHMLEDVYGIKINMRAFSFYPNYLYFGMPITAHPDIENAKGLWRKVVEVWTRNRWKVYAAFEHVNRTELAGWLNQAERPKFGPLARAPRMDARLSG
jgi:hypothetical protein